MVSSNKLANWAIQEGGNQIPIFHWRAVSPALCVHWRAVSPATVLACWGFVLLGSPLLVAYGVVNQSPWPYFAFLLPLLITFAVIPSAVGTLACLFLVAAAPRFRRAVIGILAVLCLAIGLPAAARKMARNVSRPLLSGRVSSQRTISKAAACNAALEAAEDAFASLATLNHRRRRAGEPVIAFGVGLHFGEVVYGNVGAPDRLDFTVMGPAVNRTARLESLTKTLGVSTLFSAEFGHSVTRPLRSLGEHPMKGVAGAQTVYALAEDD